MNDHDIQKHLKEKGLYKGAIDGDIGPLSIHAMRAYLAGIEGAWSAKRLIIATKQKICKDSGIDPGPIDGLPGPLTADAIDEWEGKQEGREPSRNDWRDYRTPEQAKRWPHQRECDAFYGVPLKGAAQQMIKVPTPFTLYYGDMSVNEFYVHKKCAESLVKVFE